MARRTTAQQFNLGDIVRIPVTYRHGVKTRYSGELMEVTQATSYGSYTLRLVGGTDMDTMGTMGGADFEVVTRAN